MAAERRVRFLWFFVAPTIVQTALMRQHTSCGSQRGRASATASPSGPVGPARGLWVDRDDDTLCNGLDRRRDVRHIVVFRRRCHGRPAGRVGWTLQKRAARQLLSLFRGRRHRRRRGNKGGVIAVAGFWLDVSTWFYVRAPPRATCTRPPGGAAKRVDTAARDGRSDPLPRKPVAARQRRRHGRHKLVECASAATTTRTLPTAVDTLDQVAHRAAHDNGDEA